MDFMLIMEKCSASARDLYNHLILNLPEGLRLDPLKEGHYCFRISGFINEEFDKISISYPFDAMGNRGPPYDGPNPETIETALINKGDLVYISHLGYDDVRRFFNYSDVLEELERLK